MRWTLLAILVVLSLALVILANTGSVRVYSVSSAAMAPAVPAGARVLAVRTPAVARGDIIAFRYPPNPRTTFVKRVVAIGGDTVEIRAKKLLVNGREASEPYVVHSDPTVYPNGAFLPEPYRSRDHFGPYVVPPDHFLVLGDNRDASADSRYWGPVPRANVLGRVVYVH